MIFKRTPQEKIQSAKSWKELCQAIIDIDKIVKSDKTYDFMELIHILYMFKNGDIDVKYITKTYGLRDKANELSYADNIGRMNNVEDKIISLNKIK